MQKGLIVPMKITVLIENTTDSDLQCEHGLSLYIEYKDKKILLDAGSTEAFADNARKLGIDLRMVDFAFLSHGHYDHSGGFGVFMQENQDALFYTTETAFGRYASDSGGSLHEIGVPEGIKTGLRKRSTLIKSVTAVWDGITLVPHNTPHLECIGKRAGLYCEQNGKWVADDFSHEMSVVFETDAGLVICNSCSHGGVRNIVEEVKAALPGKKIYAYVGGLHMKGREAGTEICTFTKDEVKALTDYVKSEDIRMLITGHCTGAPAMQLLEVELEKERLFEMCSGKTFII